MNEFEYVSQKILNHEAINWGEVFDFFRQVPKKSAYFESVNPIPLSLVNSAFDQDLAEVTALVYFSSLYSLIQSKEVQVSLIEVEKRGAKSFLMSSVQKNGEKIFVYKDNLQNKIENEKIKYAVLNFSSLSNHPVLSSHLLYFLKEQVPLFELKNVFKLIDGNFFNQANQNLNLPKIEAFIEKFRIEEVLEVSSIIQPKNKSLKI